MAAATAFRLRFMRQKQRKKGGGCCHTHSKGPNSRRQQHWGQETGLGFQGEFTRMFSNVIDFPHLPFRAGGLDAVNVGSGH